MKHFALVFSVVLAFAVGGLFLTSVSLTGNSFLYGQDYGPEGQKILNNRQTWQWGSPSPERLSDRGPSTYVCCDAVNIAAAGLHKCPSTRAMVEKVCSVSDEIAEEGRNNYANGFLFPPCLPNNERCALPESK